MKHCIVCSLVCLLLPTQSFAVPSYDIVTLGLTGPEHTAHAGFSRSYVDDRTFARSLNSAGHVIGMSSRYNGGSEYLGDSAWLYNGVTALQIGFTGAEYTRSDGYKTSRAEKLNEAGQVLGYSERYDAPGFRGRSVWIYDGATSVEIGLTGSEHTGHNGRRYSSAHQLNAAGQVVGSSERFNGGSQSLGVSAWLYDGAKTINIGLVGSEFTRGDGYRASYATNLSAEGQAAGFSDRYVGVSNDGGRTVWLYDGVTTIDIGLTGPEYIRNDGFRFSSLQSYSDSGHIAGTSARFNGGSSFQGSAAWIYDGVENVEVGLVDSEHTRNDGYRQSHFINSHGYPFAVVNKAGQTAGISERFNVGGSNLGSSAWFYDGNETVPIGLAGPEHTTNNGHKENYAQFLNEAGHVLGASTRYDGGAEWLGSSVWLFNGTTSIDVGLSGPEHTRNDGFKLSDVYADFDDPLNEAGQVIGYSNRYHGGNEGAYLGRSAWLYNGETTIDIGLTGPEYTRGDGFRDSMPRALNDAGQVVGISQRYGSNSQDVWFYDPTRDQTIALRFSGAEIVTSEVKYLGEDGLVLGTYNPYVTHASLGQRAFSFTIEAGWHDLGSLVDGGMAAAGWSHLAEAVRANRAGHILGHGISSNHSELVYLLRALVPEPNGIVLAALAAVALVQRRRKGVTAAKLMKQVRVTL